MKFLKAFQISAFSALFLFSNLAFAATADLVTNQVVSPIQGPAGGTFTYTLTTTNAGPDAATGVQITDSLPAGSQFISVTSTQGICTENSGTVSCTLGDVAAGSSGVTTTIKVVLPTPDVYTNTLSGTTTAADPNPSNNTNIQKTTTAYAAADLQMNGAASSSTVVAGQPYTYSLSIDNKGPSDVPSGGQVFISFSVPAGASITSLSGAGWTCTPSSGYPLSSGNISCSAAAIDNGASSSTLTVNATANQTGSVAAAFSASATDGSGNTMPDGNLNNNTASVTVSASSGSDVAISGTVTPNPVALNGTATYTLTPRFNGGIAPGSTGNRIITVTSTLPTGLTYVPGSAAGNGWSCTAQGQVITCTRTGPYTGGNYSNMPQITYRATTSQTGILASTVSISAPETDLVPSNNTATINVTSSNTADLWMRKFSSLNPVVPDQAFNYTLLVNNQGPLAVATGQTITVTDPIPSGVTITAAPSGSGWTCSSPSGGYPAAGPFTLTCTRPGPLAQGNNAPDIVLPAVLTSAASVTNTATVALSGNGPTDDNTNNNSGSVSVTASSTSADLSITKAASGNVDAGQALTYTITVKNNGPDASTNVTMTDQLSNLLASGGLQNISTTQGTCTPATLPANGPSQAVSCNLGTLANQSTATIQITVLPSIAITGTRSNTATIYSPDVGDPVQTNNSATATSQVTAVVDLALTKTATPSSVPAGAPLTYQVTVKNNGPSTAQGVTLKDILPTNATFIRLSNVSNGGACTPPAAGATGGTMECQWASIPSGSQYTATYQIRPTTQGSNVTNSATVSTTTKEPNLANNSATTTTPVTAPQLDLSITKSHTPDPVALGALTTYTITVRNAGPSQDTNVVMTDIFPDATQTQTAVFSYAGGLTVNSGGTCTTPANGATSGSIVCTFPTLDQGQTATITYTAKADAITQAGALSGTMISQASVKGDITETTMANNSVQDYTTAFRTANPNADLGITKTLTSPSSGYLTPGATATYQISVINNGPATSQGAQMLDTLPSNLQFTSATGGCVFNSGTITCDLGTMPSGSTKVFDITTKVASSYNGATPIVNEAKVDAPGDPKPGNNTASATSKVASTKSIPTLSEWAMLILGLIMLATGAWYYRQNKI